ncbi:MAG: nuclear transport factor 2 family protein, partial [Actinobacteria bacterium]
RYADLLPDGPARARAAATARSVAVFVSPDPDSLDAIIAPDGEYVDHRPLGFPTLRGAEAIRRWIHSLFEAADDLVFRLDDVLGLSSDAFLVRMTNLGTDRASGGTFERRFIALIVFGVDGLVRRWEVFDADRGAEALARFEELTAEPAAARPTAAPPRGAKKRQHRVRANAATASTPRFEAVFAARDA